MTDNQPQEQAWTPKPGDVIFQIPRYYGKIEQAKVSRVTPKCIFINETWCGKFSTNESRYDIGDLMISLFPTKLAALAGIVSRETGAYKSALESVAKAEKILDEAIEAHRLEEASHE
jgi:hypothetical protein